MAKTNFLHKSNTDDVHARSVIVGLVNLLNTRVQFSNVLADTDIDNVTVPFFYSMTGDERFLQDYFLEWNDCVHPKIADGNYDVIPRGIVTLENNTINTAAMTHRFVRGTYTKEVNGQVQTYNSFLNSIPLKMSFKVSIEADSNLDAFKIQQSIIETFYKTQVYSIKYKGFRVPCQAGFPEDYGINKTFEFTYKTENKISIEFTLEIETYLPVVDLTSERLNINRITSLGGPGLLSNIIDDKSVSIIDLTEPDAATKYFSGSILPIQWQNTGTILRVNIYYKIKNTNNWVQIARSIPNAGQFDWQILFFDAAGKTTSKDPIAVSINTEAGRNAEVRAIISAGGVDKLVVFNQGNAYTNVDTINVFPFITGKAGMPTYTIVTPVISLSVSNGEVVGGNIISAGSGFPVSPETEIQIKIEDAVNSETVDISTGYFKIQ
jgi:hypothetical protein